MLVEAVFREKQNILHFTKPCVFVNLKFLINLFTFNLNTKSFTNKGIYFWIFKQEVKFQFGGVFPNYYLKELECLRIISVVMAKTVKTVQSLK